MLKNGEETPPHLDIHKFCIECGQLGGVSVIIESDIQKIRESFQTILFELFTKPTVCLKCGGTTIPLGYTWSSHGWMLEGFNKEEVEQYYKVVGTIKNHPKNVRIFQSTTSTMVEMKNIIISKVNRSEEKIMSFSKDREIKGGEGVFLIDLPQYTEDLSNFKPTVQQELAEWR